MNLPIQISHNTGAYTSASFIGGVAICILGAFYIDLYPGDHTELKSVLGMVGALTFQRPVTWSTKPPTVELPALTIDNRTPSGKVESSDVLVLDKVAEPQSHPLT